MKRSYGPANLYTDQFLSGINPYIRLAYYDILPPHKLVARRVIYDYEIVLIKSGTAAITVEDQIYEAGPGDVFLFKPGQPHSISVYEEPLVQPHIHFDLCYSADTSKIVPISYIDFGEMTERERNLVRPDITGGFFSHFPNYIRLQNTINIEQLIFDVIDAYCSPSIFPEIRLKWCFLRLFDHLLCELNWINSGHSLIKSERAALIKQYLDHHTERQITLDELAKVHHIEKSYVSRIFKEAYDISPMQYHLLQRIEKAKLLIPFMETGSSRVSSSTHP